MKIDKVVMVRVVTSPDFAMFKAAVVDLLQRKSRAIADAPTADQVAAKGAQVSGIAQVLDLIEQYEQGGRS